MWLRITNYCQNLAFYASTVTGGPISSRSPPETGHTIAPWIIHLQPITHTHTHRRMTLRMELSNMYELNPINPRPHLDYPSVLSRLTWRPHRKQKVITVDLILGCCWTSVEDKKKSVKMLRFKNPKFQKRRGLIWANKQRMLKLVIISLEDKTCHLSY